MRDPWVGDQKLSCILSEPVDHYLIRSSGWVNFLCSSCHGHEIYLSNLFSSSSEATLWSPLYWLMPCTFSDVIELIFKTFYKLRCIFWLVICFWRYTALCSNDGKITVPWLWSCPSLMSLIKQPLSFARYSSADALVGPVNFEQGEWWRGDCLFAFWLVRGGLFADFYFANHFARRRWASTSLIHELDIALLWYIWLNKTGPLVILRSKADFISASWVHRSVEPIFRQRWSSNSHKSSRVVKFEVSVFDLGWSRVWIRLLWVKGF